MCDKVCVMSNDKENRNILYSRDGMFDTEAPKPVLLY